MFIRRTALMFRFLGSAVIALSFAIAMVALLLYRARREPAGGLQYVALGSSFAAGLGLGKRPLDNPLVCMRSINGYPQQLARTRGLSLIDMTCSGATAKHILYGGLFVLGPQLRGLNANTMLVTITVILTRFDGR